MSAVTVFDTNAYQKLPSTTLEALIAAERRDDILPHADPWVAMELLAKVLDTSSRVHGRAAIKKLYYHCGGLDSPRMIVDCEDQVCRALLNTAPEGYASARDSIGVALARVATSTRDDGLEDIMPAIREIHDHLTKVEDEHARLVFEGIVKVAAPGATTWDAIARDSGMRAALLGAIDRGDFLRAIVASEVIRAHKSVGVPVPEPVPDEMVTLLLRQFPYPFHFEVAMLRGVVEHGWSIAAKGRRNSVWDAQICFNAGQSIKGHGTVTLVTCEDLFHEVALRIGQAGVQRLTPYLEARGIAA